MEAHGPPQDGARVEVLSQAHRELADEHLVVEVLAEMVLGDLQLLNGVVQLGGGPLADLFRRAARPPLPVQLSP